MGQYYMLVNLTKDVAYIPGPGKYINKMLEYAYAPDFWKNVMKLIATDWFGDKIVLIGDYHDSQLYAKAKDFPKIDYNKFEQYSKDYSNENYILVNLTKNQFVSLADPDVFMGLTIFLASGAHGHGGDYDGIHEHCIGNW